MKKIELMVHDYVGFDDYGCVDMAVFIGNDEEPFLTQNISVTDMAKEFIEIRTIPSTNKLGDMHYAERDVLVRELKKAIEILEQA